MREWAERELEDAIGASSDTVTAADAGGDAQDDEPMAESGGGSNNLEEEGVEEGGAMSESTRGRESVEGDRAGEAGAETAPTHPPPPALKENLPSAQVRRFSEQAATPAAAATSPPITQPSDAMLTQRSDADDTSRPMVPGGTVDSDPRGLCLVDARNGFNELQRLAMLWTVRHRWAAGARFALNCYRHSALLVLRDPGNQAHFLLSKEGVTQGDPLSMVLYGLALLPLCDTLRRYDREVLQPWYADDAAMHGKASRAARVLRELCRIGTHRGYYPEPAKSWFVCTEAEEPAARKVFEEAGMAMQFCRGHRYVGGFVGSEAALEEWLQPKVEAWAEAVRTLGQVARRFPHTAYCGVTMSLQSEWQYLQRVVPGTGKYFGPVERAIRDVFLPNLFGETAISDELREATTLGVKCTGLGLPDPTTTAERCFEVSRKSCGVLTESLLDGDTLSWADHRKCTRDAARAGRIERTKAEEAALLERARGLSIVDLHRMKRKRKSGRWLTAMPDSLNGTELCRDEFRDNLRLRYNLQPKHLCERCDGCGAKFTVGHALDCKCGGLVMIRHNDVTHAWGGMMKSALGNAAVTYEPLIEYGRSAAEREQSDSVPAVQVPGEVAVLETADQSTVGLETVQESAPAGEEATPEKEQFEGAEARADCAGHGFWKAGYTTLFDARVTNLDCRSQRNTDPDAVLARHEKLKKAKYLERCLEMRRHFTPLVYSCDGIPGVETAAAEKQLARLLAAKWTREYSEMCGYVRTRMSLAVVRNNTMMLRGPRGRVINSRPVFGDGAGVNLMADFRGD